MDGDFAPLAELVELARRYDAMLMVDEAHATGVWGPTGRGLWETLDESAHDFPAVRIGTFSKALGSMGGFVAGAEPLVEWIANRARSYLFSTAMPESIAAASLAALHVVLCEPERRTRVVNLAADVRQRLVDLGANIGRSTSQIIPIIVGECERAVALSRQLFERGLFVPAIRPPSVPPNQSRLRLSISAAHTDDEINRLVEALAEIGLGE
jgi:7-keto-8-aminopelargonate synthetase-like enzyme